MFTFYFGIGCYTMVFLGWIFSSNLERFKYVENTKDKKKIK